VVTFHQWKQNARFEVDSLSNKQPRVRMENMSELLKNHHQTLTSYKRQHVHFDHANIIQLGIPPTAAAAPATGMYFFEISMFMAHDFGHSGTSG